MVWKKVRQQTEEDVEFISKLAKSIPHQPLFSGAHTRKVVNQANKIVTEKKLTKNQKQFYNQILDDQRIKKEKKKKKNNSK